MTQLTSLLPGEFAPSAETLQALFDEYEAGTSGEALLVKDIDKYELLLQTVEYEKDAIERGEKMEGVKDLTMFYGNQNGITTELVKAWAADIIKERESLWRTAQHIEGGGP